MRKNILIQILSIIMTSFALLSITGCGSGTEGNGDSVPVSITFSIPSGSEKPGGALGKAAPQFINSINISISAEDIPTPLGDTFDVSPGTTVTRNYFVPPGPGRLFVASAYGGKSGTGFLIYQGSATEDLLEDVNTTVTIIMAEAPYTGKFVDVTRGIDDPTAGSPVSPYKTITYALSQSSGYEPINVAAGFYNLTTGEIFPLQLNAGNALRCVGTNHTTVIDEQNNFSEGIFGAYSTLINGCKIINVLSSAINDGGNNITITNNILTNNCNGIYTQGNSIIKNNIIQFHIFNECASPSISGIHSSASVAPNIPVIEGNTITNNDLGIFINTSLPTINNNIISCNTDVDLTNGSASTIDAKNNRWDNLPPKSVTATICDKLGEDICETGKGFVDYSGAALASSPCPYP